MQIIKSIREQISEESLYYIIDSEDKENSSYDFPPQMFGIDIPFHPVKVSWPETKQLQDMSAKNPIKITSKFTMAYNVDTVLPNKTEVITDLLLSLLKFYVKLNYTFVPSLKKADSLKD